MTAEKVRENRLRRTAVRRGYTLQKSRRRDTEAIGFGGYTLVEQATNTVVVGSEGHPYSASLDDVERFFSRSRKGGTGQKKSRA